MTDQWKAGGDCAKCRRAKCCGRACKEHKNFLMGYMVRKLEERVHKEAKQ